jgi:hypothetical protein
MEKASNIQEKMGNVSRMDSNSQKDYNARYEKHYKRNECL